MDSPFYLKGKYMTKKLLIGLSLILSISTIAGCSKLEEKTKVAKELPPIKTFDEGFSMAHFISAKDDYYTNDELYGTEYSFSYDLELNNDTAAFLLSDGYGQYGKISMISLSDVEGVGTLSIRAMTNGKISFISDVSKESVNAIDGAYHVEGTVNKKDIKVTVNDIDMGSFKVEGFSLGAIGVYTDRGAGENIFIDNIKIGDSGSSLHNNIFAEDFSNEKTIFAPYHIKVDDGRLNIDHGVLLTKLEGAPAPVFTIDFEANAKKVENAYIYMTALGAFDAYINDEPVSDSYLDPGHLLYHDHLSYVTYDVTDLIKDNNKLNIVLTHGFYDRAQGYPEISAPYGDKLAVKGELVIQYKNGDVTIIPTDENFRVSNNGAVRFDDIYQGEIIDASYTLSAGEFMEVEIDKIEDKYLSMPIYKKETPPIRALLELTPVSVNNPEKGVYVYDFGQNFSGIVKVEFPSEEYTFKEYLNDDSKALVFRYGETVNLEQLNNSDDIPGNIWTRNLGTARATDYFIPGDNEEYRTSLEFKDTYHGFRYLQIEGLKKELPAEFIKAMVLSSALESTGEFTSSNAMINRFYENSKFSILSNFMDNPSDCNQRDERLGWSGDAQDSSLFASYLLNTDSFYRKYIDAMVINQTDEGAFPETAPNSLSGYGTNCWGDAPLIIAWNLYTQYGDKDVISKNYEAFKKWVDYLVVNSDNYIRSGQSYGDHLSMQGTPSELTDTAYSAHSAQLVSKMAKVLNKEDDASKYNEIYEAYKKAWQDRFIRDDGSIETGILTEESETGYALGICFELFDDDMLQAAADRLSILADYSNYAFYPGYAGLPYMLPALGRNGHIDTAMKLLTNTAPGSLLFNVASGMTTLTESLYTVEYDAAGNYTINGSLNHHAYAGVSTYFYTDLLGLRADEDAPGYKHFYVQPAIDGAYLSSVAGSLNTQYGIISIGYQVNVDNTGTITIEVPKNTTCTYIDTTGNAHEFKEGINEYKW